MLRTHKFDEEARYTLQAMLNHSDIKTTFAYSGLEKDKQDEMRIKIDKHFFQMWYFKRKLSFFIDLFSESVLEMIL